MTYIPGTLHCINTNNNKTHPHTHHWAKKTKETKTRTISWPTLHSGELDSSVVRVLDSWWNGHGFKSRQNFLLQGQLSMLTPISVPILPPCLPVTRTKFQSFSKKCKWQVTTKYTCSLHMWLCMEWHDMVHNCMMYTERANMAAVLSGTSHVRTKQHCKHTTFGGYSKLAVKRCSLTFRVTSDKNAVGLLKSGE